MKKKIVSVMIVFMLLISFSVNAINFDAEKTYNSVVVVYTNSGVGSGFSVKENLIMTNAHVVGNYEKVTVKLYDGKTIRGNVIKKDSKKDLALISVDEKIETLKVSTDKLRIGQEVYAIGAPKDMPYTMTKGIISALERKIGQNTYVQIDASVNSGNSGGPLVDENGNVIGVITLKASDAEGIGFAINTKDMTNFIENVEAPQSQDGDSNESDVPSDDEKSASKNETVRALMTENDSLKIALCISVVINIVLGLLCAGACFKKRSKKDEFDFEIEIEE